MSSENRAPLARRWAWLVCGVALLAVGGRAAADEKRPNILHLNADDYRADAIGALGNSIVQTPNLDQLVRRGMTFSRCYTQGSLIGAVCLPSRAMMLSGRSLFRIGGSGGQQCAGPMLPEVLAKTGYETWHRGKGGNAFPQGIRAFQTNLIDDARGKEDRNSRAGASRRMADETIAFLKNRDGAKPFYIYLAPPVPHDPREAEPRFHTRYDAQAIPLPPAFQPLHPWDNGDMLVRDEHLAPWPRTPANTKQQWAEYYACITALDHHFGRILDALKELGDLDDTIVVFTGDNGLSLGEHGLFGKQNLYEYGGMHVPLVIAGPGVPPGKSDALVYLMDLFPTFCDFAGAVPHSEINGQTLSPLLKNPEAAFRPALYTAYQNGQRAVRTDRWKLIRYPLVDKTQLFDLATDPHELRNLADDPAQAARVAEMTALLEKEMVRYDDPAPLKVPNPQPAAWKPPDKKS